MNDLDFTFLSSEFEISICSRSLLVDLKLLVVPSLTQVALVHPLAQLVRTGVVASMGARQLMGLGDGQVVVAD